MDKKWIRGRPQYGEAMGDAYSLGREKGRLPTAEVASRETNHTSGAWSTDGQLN